MSGDVQFVDVSYRGLEVGARLELREVGPTTAFLEVPAPLPVGAELEVAADEGVKLRARVIRVHEQVTGAERPAGMRIRVEPLDPSAQRWWDQRVSESDPRIPEEARAPAHEEPVPAAQPFADATTVPDEGEVDVTAPMAQAPTFEEGGGNGARERGRTTVMSAQEIKEITDTAADDDGDGNADGGAAEGANGDGSEQAGRKRRRGGRRRKR